MSQMDSASGMPVFRRLGAAIGSSAEYAIAIALFGVCLLAGGAGLYLKFAESSGPEQARDTAALGLEPSTDDARAAEQAALEEAQRKLRTDMSRLEQKRSNADNADDLERQRALQRQLAALEQQKAAAAQKAAPPRPSAPPPPVAAAAPVAAAPLQPLRAPAVQTTATVDWSTCKSPAYPRAAKRRGDSGTVSIDFQINSDGSVLGQRIVQSSGHPQLDSAAAEAIAKCRFKPATEDGIAVRGTTTVRFAWKLDQ